MASSAPTPISWSITRHEHARSEWEACTHHRDHRAGRVVSRELLLQKGYTVHGIKRRASSFNTERLDHLYQDPHIPNARLTLHYGDPSDTSNLIRIVQETQPDEIYNLGAMSYVAVS